VDNDLGRPVAEALHAVGITCEHVIDKFPNYPNGSAPDEIVIDYCFRTQTIWITSDEKREKLLKRFPKETNRITLLVLKSPLKFPVFLQLKIIMRVLDELERIVHSAKGAIHFKAAQKGRATPKIIWAQHPQDRPKNF
jgi:hypothetical protein